MILKRVLTLGLLIAGTLGQAWAGDFEGQVDMKMTHKGSDKAHAMQYLVKGSKVRVNIKSEDSKFSGASIMDLKNHQVIGIMDAQKMYTVTKLDPSKLKVEKKDNHFSIKKTGKTQTILGYSAQEWDYTSDNSKGKIWFAKGLGNWWGSSMASQSSLSGDQKALVSTVLSEKLFPLKYEFDDKSGNTTSVMEVTNIEKKSLNAGLFEVPAGYKKIETPSFAGGKKPSKEDIMKMMQQYKH